MHGTEYADLVAFVAVARERSFRRAAARLGRSPSALSHVIRALEDRLGAKLLNRTTRSVGMTEAGRDLFAALAPALASIADAVSATRARVGRPSGAVRLNMPAIAATIAVLPVLRDFTRAYPEVRLDLVVEDGLTDIVAGGFDAGIRPGELLQKDMIAVRVTPDLRPVVVASPDYLAERPPPRTPSDLRDHACINYRFKGTGALFHWPFARGDERFEMLVDGPMASNDTGLILAAALRGVGLAMTLDDLVVDQVASGRLVRVLDDWRPTLPGLFLYYPNQRQVPPALKVLVDVLRRGGPSRDGRDAAGAAVDQAPPVSPDSTGRTVPAEPSR